MDNKKQDPYAKYEVRSEDPYAKYEVKPTKQPENNPKQSGFERFVNHPYTQNTANAIIGAGDSLRDLLTLGFTKDLPLSSGKAYEGGKLAGEVGGFLAGGEALDAARAGLESASLIGKSAQWLGRNGLGGLTKRLTGSTLFGAAENPEDRSKGAETGIKAGLLGEGLTAPFRAIGGAAELANPVNYANKLAKNVKEGYQKSVMKQKAAYAPVTEKYGEHMVSVTPEKYLGFTEKQTKYFTPDVKKSYTTFLEEPTFNNLHKLQSQMGRDAARVSANPNKINTAQTLSSSRDYLNKKVSSFLSRDPEMAAQYESGKAISRDEVFPYLANPTLKKISKGLISSPTPSQLSSAIAKGAQKEAYTAGNKIITSVPASHHLTKILDKINHRMNLGNALQAALPLLTGVAGIPGGVAGALGGVAAGHFLSPHAMSLAQNPLAQKIMSGLGGATRGASQLYYE